MPKNNIIKCTICGDPVKFPTNSGYEECMRCKELSNEEKDVVMFVYEYSTTYGDYEDIPNKWLIEYESIINNRFPKKTKIYVNSNKESNYEKGQELGLKDEALRNFSYCLLELTVEIEVNADGTYKILGVKE